MTPVEAVATAIFDGAGVAELVLIQCPRIGESIEVRRVTVSTTSASRTGVGVYANSATPSNLRDSSDMLGNSNMSDVVWQIYGGESVVVRWTGGTPGAVATANLAGVKKG